MLNDECRMMNEARQGTAFDHSTFSIQRSAFNIRLRGVEPR